MQSGGQAERRTSKSGTDADAKAKLAKGKRASDRPARGELSDVADAGETARMAPTRKRPAVTKPPTRLFRFVKAYWTTFIVIMSYLSLRFQARFRSEEAIANLLRRKNLRNARRIERTICQLQGLFIKVGQLISIMTNFLPEEFRAELEGLQDHVPPRPYADIERRFADEFDGQIPSQLFARFDKYPIASASIGQVHMARLSSGERVAVKVQYPGIEQIVKSDLRTLQRIFRIVGYFVNYKGLEEVYREISSMILDELDFTKEAANSERVSANFLDQPDIVFPEVMHELSTSRVLTMRYEEGVKIGDVRSLAVNGIDRKALARKVVETYCQQIFTDGVYHADPHPGNLLVRKSGPSPDDVEIVFLDFGAVADVPHAMRDGIVELLQGALTRDTQRIVRAMRDMGFVARGADDRVFERVVEYFHDKFQEQISLDSLNLKDIKFDPEKSLENLADLRRMDISIRELTANFHVPKEWILLERTLLLLMGLCTALDPNLNPMSVIKPYLERFVLGEEGDWSTFVMETATEVVKSVAALPSDMRKFMSHARDGNLAVRFQNLERSSKLFYRLGHQVIVAAIGITGAAIAIVLEGRGEFVRADYAWWTTKICGGLLVLSWWSSRHLLRRRR